MFTLIITSHPKFSVLILDKGLNELPDACVGMCGDRGPLATSGLGAVDLQVLPYRLLQLLLVDEQAASVGMIQGYLFATVHRNLSW